MKVQDLKDFTPNLSIDWLNTLNDQLFDSLNLKEKDKILLHSPSKLKSLSLALENIDKGIIADAFALRFMYFHRFLFIVYPFDWKDEDYTHNSRAKQRWQQCLNFVNENMRPAVELLLSQFSEIDVQQVERFTRDAVNDFVERIKTVNESVLSEDVKQKVVEKLNKIDILPGPFSHNFTEHHLEEFYDEMKLKGNENLVKSTIQIQRFHKKIDNDYKDLFTKNSKSSLDSSAKSDFLSYNTINDELSKFII